MSPDFDAMAFARTRRPALMLAVGATGVLLVGGAFDVAASLRAYLFAWLLCLGAALGAMTFVMIHHLAGGRWGWSIRRPGEAAAGTLPYVAIAYLPIALGAKFVFPWADVSAVGASAVLRHRAMLFNTPATFSRAVVFFVLWSTIAWLLRRWSIQHDQTGKPPLLQRLRRLSAAGLVVYFITMSLAAVDWIASREVDWYSSTFGLVTMLGQSVTGIALLIVLLKLLSGDSRERPAIAVGVVHDLGNLLQTTVILWAYVSFMQYLVIWSGNMQDDIVWFHHRTSGRWNFIGISVIALHFGAPFVFLLFQSVKKDLKSLAYVAAGVLVMRAIDLLWTIAPSGPSENAGSASWLDPIALLGVGGAWWTCFAWQLQRHPLLPRAAEIDSLTTAGNDVNDVLAI